ncbi:hypothetical protein HID58_054299 [Brassica napus]|uniref:RNase H type-1 domain-containing protein n=1 Tax=Brassica napus TaxID=3708 RepID=A0ABQ8AH60_BRANA|nr:hypothetical protein HID58_054299 [Brassica napus]
MEIEETSKVSELIDTRYGTWNVQRVRHLFVEEDANHILGLKIDMSRVDAVVWGLERSGVYNTKGGYKLLETMQEDNTDLQLTNFSLWNSSYAHLEGNRCAHEIALSVTRDHRYQSYIARGGPFWLRALTLEEAKDDT